MKIVVTGGAGFIASHITDAYIEAGHTVTVIDNLATGSRKNLHPKATFYKADIRDQKSIDRIFKKERPEIVNHHAAIAVIAQAIRDPMPTLDVNLLGTANIALAFGRHGRGTKKMIFASSCAVYGTPKKIPVTEATEIAPQSAYGLSKSIGEEIIRFNAGVYGFDYLFFRYPNVFGPRQNPKGEAGVTAIFAGLMKANKRPTIFGDGSKGRDYTYVGDVVQANVLALRRGKNDIFTLGRKEVVTDQQIFDAVARATGFKGKAIYTPFRKGEAQRICLDPRHANKVLGWKPKVALDDGIRQVVNALPSR